MDTSHTAMAGWWLRPFTSPRVVPLVMKTRSQSAGGMQLSVASLNALIGTGGMSRQPVTRRGVTPRRWQKRRDGSSVGGWEGDNPPAPASKRAAGQPAFPKEGSKRAATRLLAGGRAVGQRGAG